jgi:hypothetical protein
VSAPVPLPPLPPAADDEDYRPGGRSVTALLAEEHDQLERLCRQVADPTLDDAVRRQLTEVLTATATRHLSGEEQYLYPTVRAVLPDGAALADREVDADAALLRSLRELGACPPGEPGFADRVQRVAGQVRRHVRVSAEELLPRLRHTADAAELIRLGNRVEIAEEAAPTRPRPGTPATPPWNRVVDPALGVVDKVRDAVSGRPTRAEDVTDPGL